MRMHRRRGVVGATSVAVVATMAGAAPGLTASATAVSSSAITPAAVSYINTAAWTPPSPDAAGIAYIPDGDRLLVTDSEVEETSLYQGANFFTSTRGGSLTGTGTTLPWSVEPTGVAYDPTAKRLFVSDDDTKRIWEIASAGADGLFGTADDGARTLRFKSSDFGNTDTEDIAYDSKRKQLLLVDGVQEELFRVDPGPDGVFNGIAPAGDDVMTHSDLRMLGVRDPEGLTYDSVRDTVVVVDDTGLWELDNNGSLMNEIDLSGTTAFAPAGVAIAPASTGSGRSYYVADRGRDNGDVPGENDGQIIEVGATLPAITNRPPSASAGADQIVDLTDTVQLTGSATDDGKPGPLSYTWSKTSGPGTVTFGTPNAAATTATFSATGTYVLRFTADDSTYSDFDEVAVQVYQPGSIRTVDVPIAASSDDAQEGGGQQGNTVRVDSPDNELGDEGTVPLTPVITGLRFAGVPVPNGSEILSAKVQFSVDEVGSAAASYTIVGEASDNAASYTTTRGNISARPDTTATVGWAPPAWTTVGQAAAGQLTPELKAILQQVVNRPGWSKGNAVAFTFAGTGRRTAGAYDGVRPAPVLKLQFRGPNAAPVVNAGLDQTVQLPNTASLHVTVTDDGLPNPPAKTTVTWSKVSGPGTVTFGAPNGIDTTAAFSAPGSYVLQAAVSDGALTGTDTLTVTVERADGAPQVSVAPADATVVMPNALQLDGTVVDPGYPGQVRLGWTKVSGPGDVSFSPADAADTTAVFGTAGSYLLRLTAGNDSVLTGSADVTVTVLPSNQDVSLALDHSSTRAGGTVQLSGIVTRADGKPVAGQSVTVSVFRAPGFAVAELGKVTTDAAGRFVLSDAPQVTSRYIAGTDNGTSATMRVTVAPTLSAHFTDASVRRGSRTWVKGTISPSASGQPLRLQKLDGRRWRTVAKTTTGAAAKAGFRFKVRASDTGRYRYRVVAPAYAGRTQAVTGDLRLRVRR